MGDSGGSSGGGKFRRIMIGVHFAPDLWITSATKDVCGSTDTNDSALKGTYTCYQPGKTTINPDPAGDDAATGGRALGIPGFAGNVNSGVKVATLRALVSLDYAVTPNVTLGGRLGYAFNHGPPSIRYNSGVPEQTTKFFPFHVEVRGAYWFKALSIKGFHPYLHLGGGMAQVDGKVTVPAYRWQSTTSGCPLSTADTSGGRCVKGFDGNWHQAKDGTNSSGNAKYDLVQYDAWRKMGQGFVTVGGGGLIPMGDTGGILLNLNVMFMLGSSGTVLEPSLGYVIGI